MAKKPASARTVRKTRHSVVDDTEAEWISLDAKTQGRHNLASRLLSVAEFELPEWMQVPSTPSPAAALDAVLGTELVAPRAHHDWKERCLDAAIDSLIAAYGSLESTLAAVLPSDPPKRERRRDLSKRVQGDRITRYLYLNAHREFDVSVVELQKAVGFSSASMLYRVREFQEWRKRKKAGITLSGQRHLPLLEPASVTALDVDQELMILRLDAEDPQVIRSELAQKLRGPGRREFARQISSLLQECAPGGVADLIRGDEQLKNLIADALVSGSE